MSFPISSIPGQSVLPSAPGLTPQQYGLLKAAYSVNETLNLLSIGRTHLYELVKFGELVPTKFGKKTLFSSPDIAALLNRRRKLGLNSEAA